MNAIIEVKLNFLPLAWTLYFVQPIIEIDNIPHQARWGLHQFELAPGSHVMKIYFSYRGKAKCGARQISFNAPTGQTKKFSYYMLPYFFSFGGIKILKG